MAPGAHDPIDAPGHGDDWKPGKVNTLPDLSSLDFDKLAESLGGDANARLAAMVLICGKEKRAAAGQARSIEEQHLQTEEAAQVAAIHDQADATRAAAFFNGFGGIVTGGTAVLSDCGVGGEGLKDAGAGAGDLSKMVGKMKDADGSDAEAAGTEAGNRAHASIRRLDDLKDLSKDARDMINDAFEFLRGTLRTKAETDQAAVNGIRG